MSNDFEANVEAFVAVGVAKIEAAMAAVPSHQEVIAGLEAMLRHVLTALTPPAAPEPAPPPANDTDPPQAAS